MSDEEQNNKEHDDLKKMTVADALERGYALVPAGKKAELGELRTGEGIGTLVDAIDNIGTAMRSDSYEEQFEFGAKGMIQVYGTALAIMKGLDERRGAREVKGKVASQESMLKKRDAEMVELKDLLKSIVSENAELKKKMDELESSGSKAKAF